MKKFILDRDKVYTSSYTYGCKHIPEHRLVAISLGIPDYFNGEIVRELNPSRKLISEFLYAGMNEEEYEREYRSSVLSKLSANEIYNKVKGKVMLCYCDKNKMCHRKIVLKWLSEELGEDIVGGEI